MSTLTGVPVIPGFALDEQAVRHVLHQFGQRGGVEPGGFVSSLLDAFVHADEANFARLGAAFPTYAFWVMVMRTRSDGVTLAVRALDLLGVKA